MPKRPSAAAKPVKEPRSSTPEATRADAIKIIPLGGATEIGKNMTAYQCGDQILVVDCGVKFPDSQQLGVDLLIPDVTFLRENRDKVLGFVLTHAHEDHIGGLPFVLRDLPVPIWATRFTLGLIRRKLHEHGLWADTDWHLAEAGDRVQIGDFEVEFVHMNHSVPDTVSLVLRTPLGNILHTSDFKFDQTPVDGLPADLSALARAGAEGLMAVVTDSTNVDKPGYVLSEQVVADALAGVFREAPGRVLVATFASNIWRVQQVIDVSCKFGRKVALAGRSMQANFEVARDLGYITVADGTVIRLDDIEMHPPQELTILTTGSQGEPLAALSRMAMNDHRQVKIEAGDTVVFSSTPIPGNEDTVWRVINHLFRHGANVIHSAMNPRIHVSGHANQEELKVMVSLTRPGVIVPVHGEYRHQELWRRMAQTMGRRVIALENGDVLEVNAEGAEVTGHVQAGVVIVDGSGVSDLEDVVLRDRWHLSQDGIFVVVCTVDAETGELLAGPDCISRGAILTTEEESIDAEVRVRVQQVFSELPAEAGLDWSGVRQDLRRVVNKLLQQRTGRRPIVVPVIMET